MLYINGNELIEESNKDLDEVFVSNVSKSYLKHMSNIESFQELYQRKIGKVPENIKNGIGHFNVFRINPFKGKYTKPLPFKKRDYFKITVLVGESSIEYADKVIQVPKQALVFSNPFIPYRWDHSDSIHHGYYAIFNEEFICQYGKLSK